MVVHVCYAFRIGANKRHYRAYDDGEPSNSVGPPILGQIQSFDLTNVLVAVVRYYGGTNLGVGGLINAYRTATRQAIENSIIAEDEEKQEIRISFSYSQIPTIMKVVKRSNCEVLEQEFKDVCFLRLRYPISNYVLLEELRKVAKVEISH